METVANQHLHRPAPIAGPLSSLRSLQWLVASIAAIGAVLACVYCFDAKPEEPPMAQAISQTAQHSQPQGAAPAEEKTLSNPERAVVPPLKKKQVVSESVSKGTAPELRPLEPEEKTGLPESAAMDTPPEDTAYAFPVLGEEDIRITRRQKKRMIDQLLRQSKSKYALVPMGSCIYQGDTVSCRAFYMQTDEVTNLEYRTFLFDLLMEGKKAEFLKAKPDQKQWVKRLPAPGYELMELRYFSDHAYDDYPVVNIPAAGAEMYCRWLSEACNALAAQKGKPLLNDLRLPSDLEWAYAATNKKNRVKYANGTGQLRDRTGIYLQNFNGRTMSDCKYDPVLDLYLDQQENPQLTSSVDGSLLTFVASLYPGNLYGIYGLAGNVSEMVYLWDKNANKVKGFGTKGGSWNSPDSFLEIDAPQEFKHPEKPSPMVGFRPVMTALTIKR